MLEALNILEGYDLKAMGRNSAPYLHAVTEALKLSFADRNTYVGDPKFVPNIPWRSCCRRNMRPRGAHRSIRITRSWASRRLAILAECARPRRAGGRRTRRRCARRPTSTRSIRTRS